MKNKILLTIGLVGAVAISAVAVQPRFKTLSAAGNTAAPAQVIFPADPSSQIRIVGANYTTDTNNSTLSFSGGTTAFSVVETNQATTSVTNKLNSTNGLSPSCVVVLQHGGVCYAAVVASVNSSTNTGFYGGTNVVLASGGWGVGTSAGDGVYLMDTPITIPATATAAINGTAIYAATYPGRPVLMKLSPASTTNQINSATAIYE